VAAQDFPNADIHIIDTRLIAAGLGSVIKEAHRQLHKGASAEDIIKGVEAMSKQEQLYVLVDTLEYLHKGGRIGGAQALFGSILQIKPILTIEDGVIQPVESQRTKKNAITRVKELVMENKPADKGSYLCIQHGGTDNEALALADWFSSELELESVTIYNLPPAVLVHAGPRALAVSYFKKNTEDWTK
jgi:DegV family protein with EDD domain